MVRIGGALDLDDLADRLIEPVLKANGLKWKGWHAYRRGLATNLHGRGILETSSGFRIEAQPCQGSNLLTIRLESADIAP